MGLIEIEKKILQDAEESAAKILQETKQQQSKLFAEAEATIAAERKIFQENIKLQISRSIEQRTQLAELTANQQVLQVKRELLNKVIKAVKDAILKDEEKFEQYLKKILHGFMEKIIKLEVSTDNVNSVKKVLKELKIDSSVESRSELPIGEVELVLSNSRINCGLAGFINEQVRKIEKEIADELFKE